MDQNDLYQAAAELISQADALLIGAGAGMGVDSGLPDFRGNEGFWHAYPALAGAKITFTQIATPQSMRKDPALGWGFYGHRLQLYRRTVPHPGFGILREWAARMSAGARVFTSNVDGHFQRVGFADDQVHECHGSLNHLQCSIGCSPDIWPADSFIPEVDEEQCRLLNQPPVCPHCGHLARPNVMMFGDHAWQPDRTEAQERQELAWVSRLAKQKTKVVIVEIGAGTTIPSVRYFSDYVKHECGARLIRINVRESSVSHPMDFGIPEGALAALQGINQELKGENHGD